MAFAESYRRQVTLLLRMLPYVAMEECFALKGGTAIYLFVRAMPRLSVDIDLTYLPVAPRDASLAAINAAMARISDRIHHHIPGAKIATGEVDGAITRRTIRAEAAQIKIEVTPVLRGTVFQLELRAVSRAVEDAFGFAEIKVVSFADLFCSCRRTLTRYLSCLFVPPPILARSFEITESSSVSVKLRLRKRSARAANGSSASSVGIVAPNSASCCAR
jgi:predicted nucleotidyltransferase component of viral defense system